MKRRVVLARSAGQELRAEKVRVLFDGKILSFTMDVGCRGHLMAAGDGRGRLYEVDWINRLSPLGIAGQNALYCMPARVYGKPPLNQA